MKTKLFFAAILIGCASALATAQGYWSLQTNPTSATGESMQFVSAQEGWIGLTSGQLLHTTNAGSSWQVVTPNSGDGSTGIDAPGSRVSFVDASTGWVLKTLTTTSDSAGAVLYKTTNAGQTWTSTVLSNTIGDSGIQVQFVDANHGWVLIFNMGTGTATFLKTTNGGATWTPTDGGGIFYYVSPTVGYAFSAGPNMLPPYTIYKTTDAGDHWTPQFVDNTDGELNAIQFTDADHGWVVGRNGKIFHTVNGGATWTAISNSRFNVNYKNSTLSFINNTTGWIASEDVSTGSHFTLSTTDGGVTWATQPMPFNYKVFCMDFWDADHGWAAADGGPIAQYSTATGAYNNAILSGPWFYYTPGTTIDPFNDNLGYIIFDGNGFITGFNGFVGGPPQLNYGTYTVFPDGQFSGTLNVGSESFPIGGQLTSPVAGQVIGNGQNFVFSKVSNPGALQNFISGSIDGGGTCGARNVTLYLNGNGQITGAVGLSQALGHVFADQGVFIGHFYTGESGGWREVSISGYYANNTLTGLSGLDMSSCGNGPVNMTRNMLANASFDATLSMTIYPNPNQGTFNLQLQKPQAQVQIEIFNAFGQRVYSAYKAVLEQHTEIRFEPQSQGVYFLKVSDGISTYKDKILIR